MIERSSRTLKKIITLLFLTLAGLCLYSCNQDRRTVLLKLSYEPGMSHPYLTTYKIIERVFEHDAVIANVTSEVIESGVSTVRRMINDSTAEIVSLSETRIRSLDKIKSVETDTTYSKYEKVCHLTLNGSLVWFDIPSDTMKTRTEYMRRWWQQTIPVYPAEEVYEGYSWTQSYHVSAGEDDFETSTTYRIKSFVHDNGYDCAVIAYEGSAIIGVEPSPSDSTRLSGLDRISTKGLIYFEYNLGMIVHQTKMYTVNGDRKMEMNGEMIAYKHVIEGNVELTLPRSDLL